MSSYEKEKCFMQAIEWLSKAHLPLRGERRETVINGTIDVSKGVQSALTQESAKGNTNNFKETKTINGHAIETTAANTELVDRKMELIRQLKKEFDESSCNYRRKAIAREIWESIEECSGLLSSSSSMAMATIKATDAYLKSLRGSDKKESE